jgi:hypothetical protein
LRVKINNLYLSVFTVLTVRDDSELKPPPITRRQRMAPSETMYDRRRYRPLNREHTHSK